MLLNEWDIPIQNKMSATGLCEIIEHKCQPEIKNSICSIEQYFNHLSKNEVPESVLELVQLIYSKLQDEVEHVFLKESGLIFPYIKKEHEGVKIEKKASEKIHQTQQVIVNLLLKLRQLLNNYVVKPNASQEWKACVHEFFQLESKIHRWVYIEQSLLYPSVTNK